MTRFKKICSKTARGVVVVAGQVPRFVPRGTARMNCVAGLICLFAFGILILNFQATPAGAGLDAASMGGSNASVSAPSAEPMGSASVSGEGLSVTDLNRKINSAINGSRVALQLHVALLELGKQRMQNVPDYSATFIKQEKLEGEDRQDIQTLNLKMRHQPFSVYMKWLEGGDVGREVLFVEGHYDDRMQVRLGGNKGKLLPTLKLDPTGSVAMKEARHAVTEMGLYNLCELILKYRKRDLGLKQGLRWQMLPDQKFADRDCYGFVVEYDSKEIEPIYRKAITYIDKEHNLPICVRNFGWPEEELPTASPQELDEATMIEYYGYKDLRFEQRLSDADFDKANKDYTFRR